MITGQTPPHERLEKTPADFEPAAPHGNGRYLAEAHPESETYYGLPALKPTHYGWPIIIYFFVGGLASAAQFIATVIDLIGHAQDRGVVRAGRYLAFLGSLASPALLIADLHTPQRWYNMLRIFRSTSPMSLGAWALSLFGTLSGLTLLAQIIQDLGGQFTGRWMSRLFGLPAAVMGGIVSLYTGTLLAATSVPLWAAAFPFLSSLFAASATSTATASLTLAAEASNASPATRLRLRRFAFLAGATELLFALLIKRRWEEEGLDAPLREEPISSAYRYGALGLGIITPLFIHLLGLVSGRESRKLAVWAAMATLVGGFILRAVLVFAGNESARRPQDYFNFTQAKD